MLGRRIKVQEEAAKHLPRQLLVGRLDISTTSSSTTSCRVKPCQEMPACSEVSRYTDGHFDERTKKPNPQIIIVHLQEQSP